MRYALFNMSMDNLLVVIAAFFSSLWHHGIAEFQYGDPRFRIEGIRQNNKNQCDGRQKDDHQNYDRQNDNKDYNQITIEKNYL